MIVVGEHCSFEREINATVNEKPIVKFKSKEGSSQKKAENADIIAYAGEAKIIEATSEGGFPPVQVTEAYLEPSRTSKLELFTEKN